MQWLDVDAARDYVAAGGARTPSRKVLYGWVRDGMRVVRLGDSGRRLLFSREWIDEYLTAKSTTGDRERLVVVEPNPSARRRA